MRQEVELKNMKKWSKEGQMYRIDDLIEKGFNVEYDYETDILTAWKGEKVVVESK